MNSEISLNYFLSPLATPSSYRDKKYDGGVGEFETGLGKSSTLYIGNLSFYTTEEQIISLFSRCGPIKKVIMGLDRNKKTPCGFAFVECFERGHALKSKSFLDGIKLDERFIRVDIDAGFKEGRQYGRGKGGGQVREDFRVDYDPGRGGWGGLPPDKEELTTLKKHRF